MFSLPPLRARCIGAVMVLVGAAFALGRVHAQAPTPPELSVRAYVLLDATSHQVLASKNADQAVEPASLTKLMSAYLVFQALQSQKITLQQTVTVSERASRMPGLRMFLAAGAQVPVEDLIKGMVVQSANDATVALAEAVAGSVERFVGHMNAQSRALGLNNTRYHNPEGLTAPGHSSTARDLSVLADSLLRDFPQYASYFAIQRYRYPSAPAGNDANRNLLLLRDPSVDGLMVGYTKASDYGMVASARRVLPSLGGATQGQRRLLGVVLGAVSPNASAAASQALLNWGYAAFESVRLYAPGQAVVTPDVWKGQSSRVSLGRPDGVVVSLPKGQTQGLRTEVLRPNPLMAPLQRGQTLGTLRVRSATGEVLAEVPLTVLETVEEAGAWGRAWGALRLWIR